MNDLEAVKLCAEAMQLSCRVDEAGRCWLYTGSIYNPLHDKAQSFELLERYSLSIDTQNHLGGAPHYVAIRDDRAAAHYMDKDLARAIVYCVAKLQAGLGSERGEG